ncbi:MAG TPA: cytochrome c [Nitrospirae bacterium]|nr:cytochrome c [Nitrospirota bacterium]
MIRILIVCMLMAIFAIACTRAKEDESKTELKFSSNGESVYFTGVSQKNGRIMFEGGPSWMGEYGGNCGGCHGPEGKGGVPIPDSDIVAADTGYKALTVEEHAHDGKKEIHTRYTDKLIKRAITEGLNPEDETLDIVMPRYKMSDDDLNDLIEFLKTLE